MNVIPAATQPDPVLYAPKPQELAGFRDPACRAAIWQRRCSAQFLSWIAALPPEQLPRGRVALPAHAVHATVEQLCDIAHTPKSAERSMLVDDITALAEIFADLTEAKYLRLRLDAVETNACRKFHIDAITARLVCTYRGTGTQFGTAKPGKDPVLIQTVPTGAPILLKGSLLGPQTSERFLHRSPPIEGTGQTRLVLVLDPITDPEATG